jgi:hypothetical protein
MKNQLQPPAKKYPLGSEAFQLPASHRQLKNLFLGVLCDFAVKMVFESNGTRYDLR